jgi:hypothetical protein
VTAMTSMAASGRNGVIPRCWAHNGIRSKNHFSYAIS